MPAKDPAVDAHHLRLGRIGDDLLEVIKQFPGWAVVQHLGGKNGEHPHYHIWCDHSGSPITAQTVRNRLKKFPAFSTISGNGDWSIRAHDNFDIWASYVMTNKYDKQPEIVVWNRNTPRPPVITVIENVLPIVDARAKIKSAKTQYEMVNDIWFELDQNEKFNFDRVYEKTADVLRRNKKGGDIYYIIKMMEMVCMYYYQDDHKSFVKQAWNSRHKM